MNKYRALTLVAASMLIFGIVQAGECGDGLPCGSIPWPQPNPPQLVSPSPMPTIGVTVNPPTNTPGGPTATPTPTPVPTSAPFSLDLDGLNDQFGTLQAALEATEEVVEVSGTPVTTSGQLDSLADNSFIFFSYVRGIGEADLGGMTPFITFAIISFLTVIAVKSITFILPVLIAIFYFLKGVIDTVLKIFR